MRNLSLSLMALAGLVYSMTALTGGHEAAGPSGQEVYEASCANCHSSFIGGFFSGAPDIDDKEDWAALLPKGVDGLTATTIAGIGDMAPRGACADCTDEEIRAAVEYIVQQVR